VENQHFADERIPLLLKTPAAVRFVSAEPLLEAVLLDNGTHSWLSCTSKMTEDRYEAMSAQEQGDYHCCESFDGGGVHYHGIDWVIVGGESGTDARPFDVGWARSIVQQCQAAAVPVFVKQLGSDPTCGTCLDKSVCWCAEGLKSVRDRKGGDPSEWPEDLRVRDFPPAGYSAADGGRTG
jgi:protein gp37